MDQRLGEEEDVMTTIVSYFSDIDMSDFSLSFLVTPSTDPLSEVFISSYSEHEVTIGGYNGGHGFVVLQGDFPIAHQPNEIPDNATITGFKIFSVGSLGYELSIAVDGISVSWSDLTTTTDSLLDAGPVTFAGGRGDEIAYGSDKSDDFAMGRGNDQVFAGGSIDILSGEAGADYLSGGAGMDMIEGGRGNDQLVGGADGDYFLFFGRTGQDVIEDYEPGDIIEFSDVDVPNLEALKRRHITEVGDDVHIDVNDHMSIIVKDADAKDLNFVIANF